MTPNRYHELLIDNNVFPIGLDNHLVIRSNYGDMLIEISCIPTDAFLESYNYYKSRLILMVYPSKSIEAGTRVLQAHKSKLLVMIDCDESDSAYTYQLTIDESAQTANIKIYDMPENGTVFITESDIIGFTKKMWAPVLAGDNNALVV